VEILGILEPQPLDYLGPEKMRIAKYHIDFQVFHNCLGMCMFIPYSYAQIRDVVRGVTGWNTSLFDMMKAGERALAMARAFNYLHGLTAQDDTMPARFFTHLESELASAGAIPEDEFAQALGTYYAMRGWDKETGAPTAVKLHELDLGWVAEMLHPTA
jgi:aldehyde:ferredoxin oxidoreductase